MNDELVPSGTVSGMSTDDMIRLILIHVEATRRDIAETRELIERVMAEVSPTLEAITNHPMLGMFMKGLKS